MHIHWDQLCLYDIFLPAGFYLPSKGLERFCGGDVYVGVHIDSHDMSDPGDMEGRYREPSEVNNIKWSTKVTIIGLECGKNRVPEKKCKSSNVLLSYTFCITKMTTNCSNCSHAHHTPGRSSDIFSRTLVSSFSKHFVSRTSSRDLLFPFWAGYRCV